jgi:hypothetical protein
MAHLYITDSLPLGRPSYGGTPLAGGIVLAANPEAQYVAAGDEYTFTLTAQITKPGSDSVYDTSAVCYIPSFFGDYYNRLYVIPANLSLVDPIVDSPNKFYFWNTNFETVHYSSYTGTDDLGMVLDIGADLALGDIKLTPASISITADAPEEEIAQFVFSFDNGQVAPWQVTLLRTNLLAIYPETPIQETIKWKTDVITARDGTEQRISTAQFARVEHAIVYNIQDDDDMRTIFTQFESGAMSQFSYPLWAEQTRIKANAAQHDINIMIDTTVFDLKVGDSLYFEDGAGKTETVKVDTIAIDNLTITLSAGLQNDWTTQDHVYRITQCLLPSKPQLKRSQWGHLEASITLRLTEWRDLFSADAALAEIAQETLITDRVLTTAIPSLLGIPIINARPIVDGSIQEDFEWNVEVQDFDTGAIQYFSDQLTAQVTWARKFLINNKTQKFVYNYLLNYMHGMRRPVWLPTWVDDFGDTISSISGNTIIVTGEKYANDYPLASPNRGLWFSYNGGWFPRFISNVSTDGGGNTQIVLSQDLPAHYPTTPPGPISFMNLCRQATDEVQRELHPFYSMLSTSFIGTKASPEIS